MRAWIDQRMKVDMTLHMAFRGLDIKKAAEEESGCLQLCL